MPHFDNSAKMLYFVETLLYRATLDLAFAKIIAPRFSYYMDLTLTVSHTDLILTYIVLIICSLFTYERKRSIANIFLQIQLFIFLIPMMTMCSLSGGNRKFFVLVATMHIVQCLVIKLYQIIKKKRWIIPMTPMTLFIIIIMGIGGSSLLYTLYVYGGASLDALNFQNIYSIRENIQNSGFPMNYFVPWTFKVIIIVGLLICIYKRKWVMCGLLFLGEIYFYLIYANKSTLFTLLLAISCVYISQKDNIGNWIAGALIAVIIGTAAIYEKWNSITPISYLVRRALLLPAKIRFAYYDFFNNNLKMHFANNTIGAIFDIKSSYSLEPAKLIAKYLGAPDSHCNSGYWGDAYANFGVIGVVSFSMILIIYVILLDRLSERIPATIIIPCAIVLFYGLNDSALLTWLLGGGALLELFLLWLYSEIGEKNEQIQENSV